ncbi:DUF6349 family protein [Nonomuraea sp. NPDC052265]|uniref:DUF6349 family protein n=1 Tax=Nonomuraea sp. NPDC052265 TaxID=3364374 RepID=UPI0037C981BB
MTATLTQPSVAISHPDPGHPGGHCRVTVRYWHVKDGEPSPPTVHDPTFHMRYRSHCGGCGDEGPVRSRENEAAEDGCDHAYPGWRDLPVMEHRPYEGKPLARWQEECRRVYPAGWFERQGPVREYRNPGGTRHVPGYAPGGGYCMAVLRQRPQPNHPTPAAVQGALFG